MLLFIGRCCLAVALKFWLFFADVVPARSHPSTKEEHDGQHDFDFEIGAWKVRLLRPLHPLSGSTTSVEYQDESVVPRICNGRANLVEVEAGGPEGHIEVLSVHDF